MTRALMLNASLHLHPDTYFVHHSTGRTHTLTIQTSPFSAELDLFFPDAEKVRELRDALDLLALEMTLQAAADEREGDAS